MIIRQTNDGDLNDVLSIEQEAFNSNKEADLVKEMLIDPKCKTFSVTHSDY